MIDEKAAERMLTDAGELAYPRYPGTAGDRRAIRWVAEKLRQADLEVEIEEFRYDIRPAFRALRTLALANAALVAAAGILAASQPLAALVLLTLGFATAAILLGWSPWSERLYRGDGPTQTANVAGRRRARGATPRLTLILLAHHDSKSQNLSMPWRGGLTLAALLATAVVTALAAATLAAGSPLGPPWLAPAAASVAVAALLVLATLTSGNRSPGGVDNAGSVALVLELARRLPGAAPGDVEWIFLSPGAEEDHMVGAMRWLDRHGDELRGRPTWALNFDGAGNPGQVVLLERFGFGRLFSPPLSALARRVAARHGIEVRGVWMPPAMGIDAIPFAHRGIDCLTLSSGSLGRATFAIHSAGDVATNLDAETLARCARLGEAIALDLAGSRQ